MIMKTRNGALACAALFFWMSGTSFAAGESGLARDIERGRYLVTLAGCNDCHTPGFMEKGPEVPEGQWLTGLGIGFSGPWGTTYPANLRRIVASITEEQWMVRARVTRLPPMPSYALQSMTDEDLRAVYRYVRSLGPAGEDAPAYVAPGGKVDTPFFDFVPQVEQRSAHAGP
jgi:mono/diheme cytochrome c family protein